MTKWIIFLAAVYIFGAVFGGMVEGSFLGEDETSHLETVLDIETYTIMGISIPKPSTEWLSATADMLLWEYAFFYDEDGSANEWSIIKWLIFLPISLGLMYTFVVTFVPILLEGIRAVRFW